jgi:polar amino acid transport system substrate-binding protein
MRGFVDGDKRYATIFDRWFGSNGVVFLNNDLRDLAIETMQIVIESREEISK